MNRITKFHYDSPEQTEFELREMARLGKRFRVLEEVQSENGVDIRLMMYEPEPIEEEEND